MTHAELDAEDRADAAATMRLLTGREREVLVLVCKGLKTYTGGAELGITKHTVTSHLEHIRRKTGIPTLIEVAVTAAKAGIV